MIKITYTAKIFLGDDEIARHSGDDIDQLYAWMLVQAEEKFGNVHGQIIEDKSKEVIRRFRKAPPD